MRRIAVTGSRVLPALRAPWVLEILAQYTGADEYLSGCQTGIDVFFADAMMQLEPDARHILFGPAALHDYAAVSYLRSRGATYVECSSGKSDAESYRIRNKEMMLYLIAEKAEGRLVAFPLYDHLQGSHSGTWSTIRLAQKLGIDTDTHILNPRTK